MREEGNLKLSMLMDDELDREASLKLFEQIEQDHELQARWHRYNIARSAFNPAIEVLPQVELVSRVSQVIANEPLIVAPQRKQRRRYNPLMFPFAASLAASLALVAIIVFQPQWISESLPVNQSLSVNQQPVVIPPTVSQQVSYDRFDAYLKNHHESAFSAGAHGILTSATASTVF